MVDSYGLLPGEREYLIMLRVTCALRDRRFGALLQSFREDVLVPSTEAWAVLRQWFVAEGYVEAVSLVDEEGVVAATGDRLQSIDLDETTRAGLLAQIEQLATADDAATPGVPSNSPSPALSGKKRRRSDDEGSRKQQWADFKAWLASSSPTGPVGCSGLFDVVVDGANVGYYKQNYAGAPGHVDYRQIDWMLQQLTSLGYSPLLVLHCRHLRPGAYPATYNSIIAGWRAGRLLLESPQVHQQHICHPSDAPTADPPTLNIIMP